MSNDDVKPTPEQELLVQELARDRPTIHVAVTSFLSLVAARSLASAQTAQPVALQHCVVATNQEALQYSRQLLTAINSTKLPPTTTTTTSTTTASDTNRPAEYPLVAQLWNGLVDSEQKPTRFLGRRALRHAWIEIAAKLRAHSDHPVATTTTTTTSDDTNNNNNNKDDDDQFPLFVQEFQRLLFHDSPLQNNANNNNNTEDNDAALLWDADGGKQELQRRQQRRQQQAHQRVQQEQQQPPERGLPMIEEIAEEYVRSGQQP